MASYFDMVAGISTGGIIALGLGLEIPTVDILSFYADDGRKIFPELPKTQLGQLLRLVRSIWRIKLDYRELETALRSRFGDRTFGECVSRIVIPAFMMPKTEIAVFKTDHHPDFKKDHAAPVWRVARSTSAAPTYLKGHEHEESRRIFIDGGVWANNPVMVAVIDILSSYEIDLDQIDILSLGTGNPPFELKPKSVFGSQFSWREAIKAAMFLTTDNATAQVKLLLGPERCLRIEPTDDCASIEMDDYDATVSKLVPLAEFDFQENRENLKRFFAETVSPRERHYTEA